MDKTPLHGRFYLKKLYMPFKYFLRFLKLRVKKIITP